jgi:hypothetical protein
MNNNFFNMLGYNLNIHHYVAHTLVTLGLFGVLLLAYSFLGVFISAALGASWFYWARELTQWELRDKQPFEWKDILIPKAIVFFIAILLVLIFN